MVEVELVEELVVDVFQKGDADADGGMKCLPTFFVACFLCLMWNGSGCLSPMATECGRFVCWLAATAAGLDNHHMDYVH